MREDCYCVCHNKYSSRSICEHCYGFNEVGIHHNFEVCIPAQELKQILEKAELRAMIEDNEWWVDEHKNVSSSAERRHIVIEHQRRMDTLRDRLYEIDPINDKED